MLDDMRRVDEVEKMKVGWEEFLRQEAIDDRREKYSEQYREMMYDCDDW